MASVLDVALWATEAADEEVTQTFLGGIKLILWVERAENVVVTNLSVEVPNQAAEAFFAEHGIEIKFFHALMLTSGG